MKKELKKKRASGTDIITSDPRPSNQRFTKISKDEKNSFVSDLRHIGEDSGWTTLLDFEYDNSSCGVSFYFAPLAFVGVTSCFLGLFTLEIFLVFGPRKFQRQRNWEYESPL